MRSRPLSAAAGVLAVIAWVARPAVADDVIRSTSPP